MPERFLAHDGVDWKNPENHAEQHVKRYEDGLFNIACMAIVGDLNFIEKDGKEWGRLTTDKLEKLRAFGMFFYLNNYMAAGGDLTVANEIIDTGNDMHHGYPRPPKVEEGGSAINLRIPRTFKL